MKKSLVLVALASALTLSAASAETVLYGSIRMGMNNGTTGYIAPTDVRLFDTNGIEQGNVGYNGNVNYIVQDWRTSKSKRAFDMKDYGSRIGLKGGEDLGNGTKVIFQLEWGFNGMEGNNKGSGFENRLAWIGLTGDWGTFAFGRQENPFANTINKDTEADNFNGLDYTSATMRAAGTTFYGAMGGDLTTGASMWSRVGNSIAYVSPSFNGFSFNVAAVVDEGDAAFTKNRNVDIWTINLAYEHESGFYAGAGVISADLIEGQKRPFVYGLKAGFKTEQWGVNATLASGTRKANGYSTQDFFNFTGGQAWLGSESNPGALVGMAPVGAAMNNADSLKQTTFGWDIGGHFSFGADYASTVRLNVGQAKQDNKANYSYIPVLGSVESWGEKQTNKLTTWAIGFEQKLSNRTKVWIEYANESTKVSHRTSKLLANEVGSYSPRYNASVRGKIKNDTISIGMRHDF